MSLSIDSLLATHAAAITALRGEVASELPSHWDEIYLLRYVLSFPVAAERADAIRKALAWRAAHPEVFASAASGARPPHYAIVSPFQCAGFHGRSKTGDSLFVVRAGLSDGPGLMATGITTEQLVEYNMHYREIAFLGADAETRRTRLLVKTYSLIDLSDAPVPTERRLFAAVGQTSKLSEFMYPQLLQKTVMFHPPALFSTVFALLRPLMGAKALEKTVPCPGKTSARPSAAACPFVGALFDLSELPTFLGGTCRCTGKGGCISERPNEQTRPAPPGGPRNTKITVGARTFHDVWLGARDAGHVLSYSFEIESQGLEVSAWLLPATGAPQVPLMPQAKHKAGGRIEGAVPVPAAGTVVMRFSNEHSVFTSKTVTVTAQVGAA